MTFVYRLTIVYRITSTEVVLSDVRKRCCEPGIRSVRADGGERIKDFGKWHKTKVSTNRTRGFAGKKGRLRMRPRNEGVCPSVSRYFREEKKLWNRMYRTRKYAWPRTLGARCGPVVFRCFTDTPPLLRWYCAMIELVKKNVLCRMVSFALFFF